MTQKLRKPLQPQEIALIKDVAAAGKLLAIPLFMVGAMARTILLEHVHGQPPTRASRDVDFAVVVDTWAQYDQLKTVLSTQFGFLGFGKTPHRLQKQVGDTKTDVYWIDLIPFGGVQDQLEQLIWPPDMQVIMSVTGFGDALKSTIDIEVHPGVQIKVASLQAIALLKIIAWRDRGPETLGKDAVDLLTLCTQYLHPENLDRLYEQFDQLTNRYTDLDLAGAWMLGHDARQISSEISQRKVIQLLNDEQQKNRMAIHMSQASRGKNDPLEFCLNTIEAFLEGYEHAGLLNTDTGGSQ